MIGSSLANVLASMRITALDLSSNGAPERPPVFFRMGQAGHGIARQRGVSGDHAVDAMAAQARVGDVHDLRIVEVGRDLQGQRHVAPPLLGQRGLPCLQGAKQGIKFGFALQLAQVLGIGAGDVDP
jgi:hypothetical protein